jgi:hypothetical protein
MAEALAGPNTDAWHASMKEEMESLKHYKVFELIPWSQVPKGKFVYRRKFDSQGNVSQYKSHYIFGRHRQMPGHDYNRTSAPTAQPEAFWSLLAIAATGDWDAQQFDMKTAYLNSVLSEDKIQYMEQPKSFEEPGKEDWVKVVKGLYSMKQARCIWNKTMNAEMVSWGFTHLPCE